MRGINYLSLLTLRYWFRFLFEKQGLIFLVAFSAVLAVYFLIKRR